MCVQAENHTRTRKSAVRRSPTIMSQAFGWLYCYTILTMDRPFASGPSLSCIQPAVFTVSSSIQLVVSSQPSSCDELSEYSSDRERVNWSSGRVLLQSRNRTWTQTPRNNLVECLRKKIAQIHSADHTDFHQPPTCIIFDVVKMSAVTASTF